MKLYVTHNCQFAYLTHMKLWKTKIGRSPGQNFLESDTLKFSDFQKPKIGRSPGQISPEIDT